MCEYMKCLSQNQSCDKSMLLWDIFSNPGDHLYRFYGTTKNQGKSTETEM